MKLHRWAPIGRATAKRMAHAKWAPLQATNSILVLAFLLALLLPQTIVVCQSAGQVVGADHEHNGASLMSLSSDSGPSLESSNVGDDLLAAESSQAPADGPGVSVAPQQSAGHRQQDQIQSQQASQNNYAQQAPPQQQPPQQQHQPQLQQQQQAQAPPPQQQQQQQAQSQQQQQSPQQQMYAPSHQHLAAAMQARMAAPHLRNPFMAAALAGNYGPAQQQIAAAAAASMQHQQHRPQHTLMHHPSANGAHHSQQQQQQQQHVANAAVHMHQPSGAAPPPAMVQHHPSAGAGGAPPPMLQGPPTMHHVARAISAQPPPLPPSLQAAAQVGEAGAGAMAVQESSVRHNIVPAPQYSDAVANAIDAEQPLHGAPHNVAAAATGGGGSQQLAMASSATHPIIASAGASSSSELVGGVGGGSGAQAWPLQAPDIPKIVNLEVKCEKNLMKVSIEFDKIFNGVIFSKGHYSQNQCVHVGQNSGKQQAYFDISINSCGTQGNTQNGLYGMGGNTGSGTYFENTIVIQYDPNVQEVYDHARKLRCTWHDQYEKAVTFRPFPVDMLDIVRADFAGDNVGCWMQIQVGKGPWASEVAGIVKIGQTMTMVLAIKDEENKFDMLVRNCFAHDGKRGPIELVDKTGCITRPKLMSRFTKIKNFGSSATVLSYAHFQAFKFPDSMEVHFQCTIQICRHQCPEQCSSSSSLGAGAAGNPLLGGGGGGGASALANGEAYSESTISGTFNIGGGGGSQAAAAVAAAPAGEHLRKFGHHALSRDKRDLSGAVGRRWHNESSLVGRAKQSQTTVGLNRIIHVVSTGDLAFTTAPAAESLPDASQLTAGAADSAAASSVAKLDELASGPQICMSSYNFVLALVMLALLLLCSCLLAIGLYVRQRSLMRGAGSKLACSSSSSSSSSSPAPSTMGRSTASSKRLVNNPVPSSQPHPLHSHGSQLMFH